MSFIEGYPRYITKNWKPYNPIEVTEQTYRIVCRVEKGVELRKYTSFYVAGVYRGIVTGCIVGCNLRCFFCWSPPSRDFPEKYGDFYTPEQAFYAMEYLAKKYGIRKARLSCGEPTICWNHLIDIIKLVEESKHFDIFILETNGIVLGIKPYLVNDLKKFSKVYVRVSLKAGYPQGFEWRTGAQKEYFELPYRAIEALDRAGIRFHVAAMTDPRIMSLEERSEIIRRLIAINPRLALMFEEEVVDPYDTTLMRLKYAGIKLKW